MVTETIISAATTSLIKSIAENMRPKMDRFLKRAKIWSVDILNQHEAQFNDYLTRTYERFSVVNTLVFHNSQRKLKEIYVPQTLVKKYYSSNTGSKYYIDKFPTGLVKEYNKILITDTAGMGKSTIMKRMFIDLIDSGLKGIGVPIYIELNKLNKKHTILSEIQKELNSLSKDFDNDLLLHFLQTGGFVFFLDGYDEIPKEDRNKVTQDIQEFITKAGYDNYYIMTSRPEDRLAGFGHFQELNVQPLTRLEAYDLLSKYDYTNDKVISTKLINLLERNVYDSIEEYLKNPLLVSLLYIVFDYKQKIPLKKHLFYRQVYDALFETHEEAQGRNPHEKTSGLDIDDFNRVLRRIGYECLKLGKVSFEKDEILKIIRISRDFCGNLSFNASSFLDDLLLAVPLFCVDGPEYKWVHKSLMEYFAAMFIADDAKDSQDKILTAIYNSQDINKYVNMLDLYYDIDYKGFSKNITLPLCEEFIEFYEENWENLNVRKSLIEERIGLLFYYNKVYFNHHEVDSDYEFKFKIYKGNIRQLENDYENGLIGNFSCASISNNEHIILEFVSFFLCSHNVLLRLLMHKNLSLFKNRNILTQDADQYPYLHYDYCNKEFLDYFQEQSNRTIGVKTCDRDETVYRVINDLLSFMYIPRKMIFSISGKYFSLDYNACKKEIVRIKDNICKLDIADGL